MEPLESGGAAALLRCRGGGATPPPSPSEPPEALEVAAALGSILRRARKRKLEIMVNETEQAFESNTVADEPTSWEKEAAPSPSTAAEQKVDDAAAPENSLPIDVSSESCEQ